MQPGESLTITSDFYPRPPWGGRHADPFASITLFGISIHALRGEGDAAEGKTTAQLMISIHALRGEGDLKVLAMQMGIVIVISIHALRGEGDGKSA